MEKENMLNRKPMLLVLAGPNGSGKSTITKYFEIQGIYTNADEVVASTGMDNKEAAEFVDKKRYEFIESKQDFTFETVLSSEYKMNILRKAKEEGYFIKCVFVLTNDPQINITRVETRVLNGGHDVDKEKIISRYYKSLSHIKELMDIGKRVQGHKCIYCSNRVVLEGFNDLQSQYADNALDFDEEKNGFSAKNK